jgi:hypothetical protein
MEPARISSHTRTVKQQTHNIKKSNQRLKKKKNRRHSPSGRDMQRSNCMARQIVGDKEHNQFIRTSIENTEGSLSANCIN